MFHECVAVMNIDCSFMNVIKQCHVAVMNVLYKPHTKNVSRIYSNIV